MTISAVKTIKSLYYANKPLKSAYRDNVIVKNELDGYFRQVINDMHSNINEYAKNTDLKLKLAQKGDILLINSGNNTSFINKKEIKDVKTLYEAIIDNMNKNFRLKNLTDIHKK